ncbi:putative inactive receptor kinase [Abeliophyllum distichum]|uniref:Inactive receptor kinase n=1 Tax=Abeliophyllum distichum TaxID=126358 RepID=A0ABD1VZU4_9LAMI
MSTIYDNWDRLVGAVIRREHLWKMFHDQSPSVSSASSDFSLDSPLHDFPRGSSSYPQGIENSQIKEQSVTKKLPQLVFFDGFNPAFDFDDILESPAEFMGKGTFGSTYSAVIESGITIVVKRLKEVNIPEKMFRQHMEVIGNVRHENVSPLRAYYFSEDQKLMLYDHYSNGSISAMLHGKPGENRAQLDWDTRVRIAVGAARGIAHIHTQKGGKLVHGNIKSSYIFLNSEQYGCVSDLGLANMIATSVKQTEQYHAPEVKNTRNVSQASDVYSFGILLLELLTRKSPLRSTGGDEVVRPSQIG